MRGDEAGLGTPEEDLTSVAAPAALDGVPERLVVSEGFGVDAPLPDRGVPGRSRHPPAPPHPALTVTGPNGPRQIPPGPVPVLVLPPLKLKVMPIVRSEYRTAGRPRTVVFCAVTPRKSAVSATGRRSYDAESCTE